MATVTLVSKPIDAIRELLGPPSIVTHDGMVIIEVGGLHLIARPAIAEQMAMTLSQAAFSAELGRSEVISRAGHVAAKPGHGEAETIRAARGFSAKD